MGGAKIIRMWNNIIKFGVLTSIFDINMLTTIPKNDVWCSLTLHSIRKFNLLLPLHPTLVQVLQFRLPVLPIHPVTPLLHEKFHHPRL